MVVGPGRHDQDTVAPLGQRIDPRRQACRRIRGEPGDGLGSPLATRHCLPSRSITASVRLVEGSKGRKEMRR